MCSSIEVFRIGHVFRIHLNHDNARPVHFFNNNIELIEGNLLIFHRNISKFRHDQSADRIGIIQIHFFIFNINAQIRSSVKIGKLPLPIRLPSSRRVQSLSF